MAGVKPVEYKKDSSTIGFAIAGDQKQITKDNAVTIEKDVKQGNTNDLDNAQSKYLESQIEDVDNIEYSDDERKNVGKNQINTDDTENTNGLQTSGAMVGSALQVGTGAAASAAMGAPTGAGAVSDISTMARVGENTAAIPWMALVAGAIDLGAGAAALVAVNAFDNQYGDRMNQLEAAGDNNTTIQSYYDQMAADMDTMTEDAATYADLSERKVTADVDRITQIGALQAQIAVYQAQGDDEMATQLQAQIAELTKEGEADETGGKIDELQQGLETYSGNNAEAVGVADSGATVAEFLGDGNQMGILGTANTALLTASGLLMISGTVKAAKAALHVPFLSIPVASAIAIAGAVMMVAGNAMVLSAAYKMGSKAKDEFKCADAGSEMQDNVNNLLVNVEQQGGFTESTGAEYTEIATKNAETTQKTQEGVDKANQNNPVVAPKPTGNGEGNKQDEDKPPIVGAGEGAAA